MNTKSKAIGLFLLILHFSSLSLIVKGEEISVFSPDAALKMNVLLTDDASGKSEWKYEVIFKDKPVLLRSQLGITGWENGFQIEEIKRRSQDTTWLTVYGERAKVRDCFNETTIALKKGNARLHLIVRAYNSGIAFRYFFPEDPQRGGNYLSIKSENTTFAVPENTYGWFSSYAQDAYKYLPVKNWSGECERPLTLRLENGLYVSLIEGVMVNYSRTKFTINKENSIRCSMYDGVDEAAPFATPWRVVMVSETPTGLLANNDLILNLNLPCEIADPSWIKPGKVMRVTSLSTEGAKKVIDFAVKRKIDFVHFDAGWYGPEAFSSSNPSKTNVDPKKSEVSSLNMPEVVKYARDRGVGVWLYVNQRALTNYLDEILPLYQSWGVAGIKFGFVHVGSFRWTTWLHEAVRKCAKYHLMVDIHDEYRPTGFSRTYPNLLTQEGIRGNEEFTDGNINTTHPFTRFLAGAGDYTICYYHRKELKPDLEKRLNARSLLNTSCHQMALSVIFYSPLQFLYWYDRPDDVQDEPELEFFDRLHTVWDDTKVLDGQIGEYVSVARKKGNTWFVGCITNNDKRTLPFSFDFLDPNKKYELTLYTDGGEKIKTRTHVKIEKKEITNKLKLDLNLLPRGGCAMTINELPK